MCLSEARRARLMAYCRIDELGPGEDVVLEGMYLSAVEYLAGAGVGEPDPGTGRRANFDQAVDAMVLDAWDNRGSQTAGVAMQENPAFRRLINQLKLTEPVSELDTG